MEILIYGWWILINGAMFCAEAFFLNKLGQRPMAPKWLLLYLAASCGLTVLSLNLMLPRFWGELLHLGLLWGLGRVCLGATWGNTIGAAAIVFTASTCVEGLYALVMGYLAAILHGPALGIAVQMLLSGGTALLLWGIYHLVAHRYWPAAGQALAPYLALLLLPLGFVVWVLRFGLGLDRPVQFAATAPLAVGPPLWALGCILGAWLCFFVLLEVFAKILALTGQEAEKRLLAAQLREQRNYMEEATLRAVQYRAFQHDINNHLLVLSGLMQGEKYGEAQGYLNKLQATAQGMHGLVSTGHTLVDVLLGEKIRFAQQHEIAFTHAVHLPQSIPVEDMDLCVLLSNALDNAIQACQGEPRGRRSIDLCARVKHRFLLIEVSNSCTTGGPLVPGTGLQNMVRIAQKYRGTLDVVKGEERVRCSLLLCLGEVAQPLAQ